MRIQKLTRNIYFFFIYFALKMYLKTKIRYVGCRFILSEKESHQLYIYSYPENKP